MAFRRSRDQSRRTDERQAAAAAATPTGLRPEQDPAFARVTGQVKAFAKTKKAHPPAAVKAQEAQDAAVAPTDDVAAQAKAAKADTMDAQQAGTFDKKAFIAAVKAAIEAKSPKTLEEADEYKESGKAGEVKGEVKGLVTSGKDGQAKDIEAATEAPPDQSKAVTKPVTPMAQEDPGQVVPIPAGGAVPKPAPPEQLNLAAGKHEANQEMATAEVSEAQLAQLERTAPSSRRSPTSRPRRPMPTPRPASSGNRRRRSSTSARAEAAAETAAGVEGMQGAKGPPWPSWSRTRARPSRRTRPSAPRSPPRSRASSLPPRQT